MSGASGPYTFVTARIRRSPCLCRRDENARHQVAPRCVRRRFSPGETCHNWQPHHAPPRTSSSSFARFTRNIHEKKNTKKSTLYRKYKYTPNIKRKGNANVKVKNTANIRKENARIQSRPDRRSRKRIMSKDCIKPRTRQQCGITVATTTRPKEPHK